MGFERYANRQDHSCSLFTDDISTSDTPTQSTRDDDYRQTSRFELRNFSTIRPYNPSIPHRFL